MSATATQVSKEKMKDILGMAVAMTEKDNPTIGEVAAYAGQAHRIINSIEDVLESVKSGAFQKKRSTWDWLEELQREAENGEVDDETD